MAIALTYHDVVSADTPDRSGLPGPLAARYKLAPDDFRRHLEAIAALDRPVATDLLAAGERDIILTFDDGGASALEIAAELEGFGWRGCFFVVTSLVGEPGFLSRREVVELKERGHLVGSHSHSHPTYMGKLELDELLDEWRVSRELLGEMLGAAPGHASIPGGFSSPSVLEAAARCGYEVLYTSTPDARLRRQGALTVSGRYSIWATTKAETAAAYASGAGWARRRLAWQWQLKQAAKRLSPAAYERLRRLRAR